MIDSERITAAILETGVGPLALEEGAALVDKWIELNAADAQRKIVAVECGFVVWLDKQTAVIGVQDLLTDEGQIVGNEWKSTKGPTKFWNQDKWFQSISTGSQIAIYALALQQGTYYEKGKEPSRPAVAAPRIRVRAITKSTPMMIWTGENGGVIEISDARLEAVVAALTNKAASIRQMRKTQLVPWQLPGIWCVNQFRRKCEYYGDCAAGKYPAGIGLFDESDPAFQLALGNVDTHDPDLVILGASAYAAVSECAEKYRRNTLGGNGEESMELATGTVLHAGVAEWYRQLREQRGA